MQFSSANLDHDLISISKRLLGDFNDFSCKCNYKGI